MWGWIIALLAVLSFAPARADGLDDMRAAEDAAAIGAHQEAVGLYGRALDSQDLLSSRRTDAYLGRASAYAMLGQVDRAVADYTEAINLGAGHDAFERRGVVQQNAGRLDQALADFDEAIRRAPSEPEPYVSRAGAHRAKGELGKAIADFSEAVRLAPDSEAMLIGRGKIHFLRTEYLHAIDDFGRAAAMAPGIAPQALWLHLARQRAGQSDNAEFVLNASRIDFDDWPGQVIALHLGRRSPAVVAEVAQFGTPEEKRIRTCEAPLHLGLFTLGRGAKDDAKSWFTAALKVCPASEAEADIAKAELARMTN